MQTSAVWPFHSESDAQLSATADAVFAHLDDHRRLSAHMSTASWMMLGSRLNIGLDASEGHAIGARIRLRGRVLGIPISGEEIVTQRQPPLRKVWGNHRYAKSPGHWLLQNGV